MQAFEFKGYIAVKDKGLALIAGGAGVGNPGSLTTGPFSRELFLGVQHEFKGAFFPMFPWE